MNLTLCTTFKCRVIPCAAAIAAALVCFSLPVKAQSVDADGKPISIGGKAVALTVEGSGAVRVKPDYCGLKLQVAQEGTDKAEVLAAYNKKVASLSETAKKLNLEFQVLPPQILIPVSSGYSVQTINSPVKAGQKLRMAGSIQTAVAPAQARAVIATLAATGAMEGIEARFGVNEESVYRNAALKNAVENVSARAQILAAAAKPQVLKLLAIKEGDFQVHSVTYYQRANDNSRPIEIPLVSARADVTLHYALVDPAPAIVKKSAPVKKPTLKTPAPKSKTAKN